MSPTCSITTRRRVWSSNIPNYVCSCYGSPRFANLRPGVNSTCSLATPSFSISNTSIQNPRHHRSLRPAGKPFQLIIACISNRGFLGRLLNISIYWTIQMLLTSSNSTINGSPSLICFDESVDSSCDAFCKPLVFNGFFCGVGRMGKLMMKDQY